MKSGVDFLSMSFDDETLIFASVSLCVLMPYMNLAPHRLGSKVKGACQGVTQEDL